MKQRMRRISALLLVALMCVSMVVPAFAADSTEECPTTHTKSNCEYELVEGAGKEAACGELGYSVYKCKDCGVYFAADFVESLGDHEYVTLTKKPTCTTEGYRKSVCYNCGKVKDAVVLAVTAHDWEDAAGACGGKICKVCQETEDGTHTWGKPVLVKEPGHNNINSTNTAGKAVKGTATFTCEECDATKTLDVYAISTQVTSGNWQHVHYYETIETVPSTCTEKGMYKGMICTVCGDVKAHETNGTGNLAKLTKAGTTTEYKPFEELELVECVASDVPFVKAATCTAGGSWYYPCTMCEEAVGNVTGFAPIGCQYQTKIYDQDDKGLTLEEIFVAQLLSVNYDAIMSNKATTDTQKAAAVKALVDATHDETYSFNVVLRDKAEEGEEAPDPYTQTLSWTALATYETTMLAKYLVAINRASAPAAGDSDYAIFMEGFKGWLPRYSFSQEYENNYTNVTYAQNCSTGYTIYHYSCTVCNVNNTALENANRVYGHVWKDVTAPTDKATCTTNGQLVYECQNPHCSGIGANDILTPTESYAVNAAGKVVKTVIVEAAHDYQPVVTAPTCRTQGYTQDICTVCGAIDAEKATIAGDNGKYAYTATVADAHDFDKNNDGKVDVLDYTINTAATCTKNGVGSATCLECGYVQNNIVIPMLGHKADYTRIIGQNDVADCTKGVYRIYACKNGCTEGYKVETTPAKGHSMVATVVKPSCTTGSGYTVQQCQNGCGYQAGAQTNKVLYDKNNKDHHGTIVKTGVVVTGNCVIPTYVEYGCADCKTGATFNFKYQVAEEGTGVGHDFKDVAEVPATCTTAGTKAYKLCKTCGLKTMDGTTVASAVDLNIPALEDKNDPDFGHGDVTAVLAVAPTCYTTGVKSGAYVCNDCGAYVKNNGTTAAPNWVDDTAAVLPKLEHSWNTTTTVNRSCDQWAYQIRICRHCNLEQLINYQDPLFGGHKPVDVEAVEATCTTVGTTAGTKCSVCNEVLSGCEEIAKVEHVNVYGQKFFGSCVEKEAMTEAKTFEKFNKYCTECKTPVTFDCHWTDPTVVEATCFEYSYKLQVCIYCKDSRITDVGNTYSDKHAAWGEWTVETPATTTEVGKKVRICAACKTKEYAEIPTLNGVEFTAEVENGLNADAKIINGGKLAVTIKTTATKVNTWGISLKFNYGLNMSFDSYEVLNDKFALVEVNGKDGNAEIPAKGKIPAVPAKDGVLNIVAYAYVNQTTDVVLDGEEALVTVYFNIDKKANLNDSLWLTKVDDQITDKNNNYIACDLSEIASITAKVEAVLGDVNGDGTVTVNDAMGMMFYITGEADTDYVATADVNADGEIDAADFALMQAHLVGKNEYVWGAETTVETADEDEEEAETSDEDDA